MYQLYGVFSVELGDRVFLKEMGQKGLCVILFYYVQLGSGTRVVRKSNEETQCPSRESNRNYLEHKSGIACLL
jgi:hypothetical protein